MAAECIDILGRLKPDQLAAIAAMKLGDRDPDSLPPTPLIGCGGMGGAGKTFTLLSAMAYGHLVHAKIDRLPYMTPSCLIADTIPNIKDRLIAPALRMFPGMFRFVDGHAVHGRCLLFRDSSLGAIWLRHAEELDSLRGKEVWAMGVEEASVFPERQNGEFILDLFEYPVRSTQPVRSHPILMAYNWDGIGVPWLRKCFWPPDVKPDSEGKIYDRPAERFQYIPFDLATHPNVKFARSQMEKLEAYQGAMRESRLHGRPGVPSGSLFPSFNRQTQTFRFNERFPSGLPGHFLIFMGVDWGIGDPYCALWTAIDEEGDLYTFREDYRANLDEEDQARSIVHLTGSNERVKCVYYDPSMDHQMNSRRVRSRMAVIEAYRNILGDDRRFGGLSWGDNSSRVQAWRILNMLLNHNPNSQTPRWFIEENCSNLIREIETARYRTVAGVWDDDIDPRLPDHALTAAAYHLRRIMGQKSRPEPGFGPLSMSNGRTTTQNPERRIRI